MNSIGKSIRTCIGIARTFECRFVHIWWISIIVVDVLHENLSVIPAYHYWIFVLSSVVVNTTASAIRCAMSRFVSVQIIVLGRVVDVADLAGLVVVACVGVVVFGGAVVGLAGVERGVMEKGGVRGMERVT